MCRFGDDTLETELSDEERSMDAVRSWMSSPAVVAPETMTLPEARRLLQDRGIRRVPVVDAAGQLVGIVTEGDINKISASHESDVRDYNMYHRVADLPLRDIMSRTVHTATPEMLIMDVAQILLDQRIGGVPVVENGQVVGMITESDLFRLIVRRQIGL